MTDDWYRVIGGEQREGAIIVSQFDSAVDYSAMLSGRVANVVPVDSIERVTEAVTAYTQTIGIYPESLKNATARHTSAVRRAAPDQPRLCVQCADRGAAGCDRADAADVQVDRRRGVRS